MGFHGIERYKTIPEVRYGIIPATEISRTVYVPGKRQFRPIKPETSVMRVYPEYYKKFEIDIQENGFRNPPLCWCFNEKTYVIYGTVRMWLAQKFKLDVPVFIVDWSSCWKHLELITDKKQALSKFTDEPIELVLEPDFFSYYNKRNDYDPVEIKRKLLDAKQREASERT